MTEQAAVVFHNDDGELWGVFVYGHHDIREVLPVVTAKLGGMDGGFDDVTIEQRWMIENPEEFGDDCPWELIGKGKTPGAKAVAITGFFPNAF